MTDDEKKALIVAGAVAVVGLALWLTRNASAIPATASNLQPTTEIPGGPGFTTYNVPPYNAPANSLIYPSPMNDNGNGCCTDGCFTAGNINGYNAPTSLTQLLGWYANTPGNENLGAAMSAMVKPFTAPPTTIADKIGNPTPNNSLY